MDSATTVRRLLPEIALVAVTALVVGGLLTLVGGKEAADTDATAWRAQQNAGCSAAQTQTTAARLVLEENVAATRGDGPEAVAVNALVSAAGRMSAAVRTFATDYRSHAVPANGVDRARAESVLTHAGTLSTAWNSLAAEYEDLETRPGTATTQRINDWALRAGDAADQLRRALADLDLRTCSRLAESMTPVS